MSCDMERIMQTTYEASFILDGSIFLHLDSSRFCTYSGNGEMIFHGPFVSSSTVKKQHNKINTTVNRTEVSRRNNLQHSADGIGQTRETVWPKMP